MKHEKIVFSLNGNDGLEIILKERLDSIDYLSEAAISFFQGDDKYILFNNDILLYALGVIQTLLKSALADGLYLHESIHHDIGYLYNTYCDALWNEKLEIKKQFVYQYYEDSRMWVGSSYHLWNAATVGSWIFNNKNGDIIFEIVPLYPYDFYDDNKPADAIPFDEWIKNYKPYAIRTIPKEVAVQWLNQAESLLQTIAKNVERFKSEEERNQLH